MRVKNKLIYDIGVNDSETKISGCPYYRRWTCMFERCYSPYYHQRFPSYIGCTVAPIWHLFSNFREWMKQEDWEGKELDKDLLGNGKLYSPETCIFVSPQINMLFVKGGNKNGPYPTGVTHQRNRYHAAVRMKGKTRHLGAFWTPEEAHLAWRQAKIQIAINLADEESDPLVACGLREYATKLLSQTV